MTDEQNNQETSNSDDDWNDSSMPRTTITKEMKEEKEDKDTG